MIELDVEARRRETDRSYIRAAMNRQRGLMMPDTRAVLEIALRDALFIYITGRVPK